MRSRPEISDLAGGKSDAAKREEGDRSMATEGGRCHWARAGGLVLLCLAGCLSTAGSRTSPPKVGGRLPCEFEGTHYGISSAQIAPGCTVTIAGITYFVASLDRRHVAYIQTADSRFVSPEGLRVGSSLQDVRNAGGGERVGERGWKYFSNLPSGWRAEFTGMPDHGEPRPNDLLSNVPGDTVVSFSRRGD